MAAGTTKGSFFHHFASKEALAVAAAEQWTARAAPLFAHPSIVGHDDPLDRLLAHVTLRMVMMEGQAEDFTCFVGTMVQERFASSPAIRAACGDSIAAYCTALIPDIQAAIDDHRIAGRVTAASLAWHIQSVLQGAFVIAKAAGDPAMARDSVAHLTRYILMLFGREERP